MFDGLDTEVQPLYIAPRDYQRWCERVAPALRGMADGSGGRYACEDVVGSIMLGRMHLWLVLAGAEIACALVTEIVDYPRLRAMRAVGVWGRRPRRWMHLLAAVERASAAHFGCQRMEAFVSPGHERLLKTGGWMPFHCLWDKPL